MDTSESTADAVLGQLGMTAHGRSGGSLSRGDGILHFRKKSWPVSRYASFNPSKFSRQSLSQKKIPDEALTLKRVVSQASSEAASETEGTASSLPTSLIRASNDQDRGEIFARRRGQTISFLQELQSKEHLRVVEARKSDEPKLDEEHSAESDVTAEASLSPSTLLFEQSELGPETRDVQDGEAEVVALSSSPPSDHSITSAESPRIELDGNPIPNIVELPAEDLDNPASASYEYGDTRFNTLPGESFPLIDRKPSIEPLNLGTLTEELFDMDIIEREAFKDLVQPDVDPRTGLPFQASTS